MSGITSAQSHKDAKGGEQPTKLNRFHLRITALTVGANFSDGYALGSIGIALILIVPAMGLGPVWTGLIASSALIGIFFGSIMGGWLADKFGRRPLYTLDFILIAVASAAQFFVDDPGWLLALRLVIGFGIGVDYALGPTLVAEFVPKRFRGGLLGSLTLTWTIGYTVAFFIGNAVVSSGDPDAWRWLLASGAVPAVIVVLLRIGTPESPRWLMSKGRYAEAAEVVEKHKTGAIVVIPESGNAPTTTGARYRDLFDQKNRRNTIFGIVFYNSQVIPYFAIYTFLPVILTQLGFTGSSYTSGVILNVFLIVGGVLGLIALIKIPRRPLTIWTFVILAVLLAVVGLSGSLPTWIVFGAFALFTVVMSGASNLEQVYPPELFPTKYRAAGVGLLNGSSRIGSAIGTFLLPMVILDFGIQAAVFGLVTILVVGAVVSYFMAPETSGIDLDELD